MCDRTLAGRPDLAAQAPREPRDARVDGGRALSAIRLSSALDAQTRSELDRPGEVLELVIGPPLRSRSDCVLEVTATGAHRALWSNVAADTRYARAIHCDAARDVCVASPPAYLDAQLPEPGIALGLGLGSILALALARRRALR